ncbi:MAG: glycoside hydrolase family 2 [Lachnospiraceae bacterium]|nr:glycoside hydrolase family 2 [Lachnospiraceae bacterium]
MKQLFSRWGREPDREQVWQEYPRPNLVRDSYFNLNGEWDCCINCYADVETHEYRKKILVPFSPETALSGVKEILQPGMYLHYRKVFSLPEGFRRSRVLLHFGAVDQECEVFLNGTFLGAHKGGYLPFSFDVTDSLAEENILTVHVTDDTEQSPHARGKQKLSKKGILSSLFYTPQSGIWQTVWMESVEEEYIDWVKITPLYDEGAVKIRVKTAGSKTGPAEDEDRESRVGSGGIEADHSLSAQIAIMDNGTMIAQAQAQPDKDCVIALSHFRSWSPEEPYLYDVRISYGKDEVASYFGMRKISTDRDENGILRFFLNNKPYFFNGLLDQGYWPESLMTPPCDEALVYDIRKQKEMGYNTIRKHVKVELPRFYYHCDRIGMIVWQDMPNGGGAYNMAFVAGIANFSDSIAREMSDSSYRRFKREDREGRRQYCRDLTGMVKHLYNYPCIAAWVPFNEGWGQFDAGWVTKKLRGLDKSRLINQACGWFDQKGGDIYSIHNYRRGLTVSPQKDRVVALTEYGGYAYPVKGHIASRKKFGYRHYSSKTELTDGYRRLIEEEIFPNVARGLSAAIYTQVSDIETEINGVMTYDREVDKLHLDTVKELNQKLYRIFEENVR